MAEMTRDEEVTVNRDDEKALHALLDSLVDGETVTAEWRDENGATTVTGSAMLSGGFRGGTWACLVPAALGRWHPAPRPPLRHRPPHRREALGA